HQPVGRFMPGGSPVSESPPADASCSSVNPVTSVRLAPARLEPLISASFKFAPVKSARERSHSQRFAFSRFAPRKLACSGWLKYRHAAARLALARFILGR